MGLIIDRPAPEPLEVWPENQAPLRVFSRLMTQWSVGMGGPIGLVYTSIPVVCQMLAIAPDADLLDALMAMESEALRYFSEKAR